MIVDEWKNFFNSSPQNFVAFNFTAVVNVAHLDRKQREQIHFRNKENNCVFLNSLLNTGNVALSGLMHSEVSSPLPHLVTGDNSGKCMK